MLGYRSILMPALMKGATRPLARSQLGEPVLSVGGWTTRRYSRPVLGSKCHVFPAEARTAATELSCAKLAWQETPQAVLHLGRLGLRGLGLG